MAAPILRCLSFGGAVAALRPPGLLITARASYNARRLGLDLNGFYLPHSESPEWQRGARAQRKRYGRWGSASGVLATSLWPEAAELAQHQAEWEPSLQQMLSDLRAKELEREKKEKERQKLIATNMAKMPKMVEDWRREKRELKIKQREEKARREHLLSEARERFGYSIDPRSPKFQEMVKELEKEEKKKRKLMKRRKKEETSGSEVAAAAAGTL
ncbi:growth arrest and DNA damage-inducible proteins-interacting protein 1 [Chiloscyllium plagiosum]|uniref:growth arrest and DNA damage-inducible proteins-interacting protein 1 n=1 Tax=Chiloscyllium plagiosum TaxID=36176 RepID=UPI001CB832DD|nr:growth arrest and DNA damage-inducible proteins-interacting protein 1 [Chiloscyllium plagiosum]